MTLWIVTGTGPYYGTGHDSRMQLLSRELERRKIPFRPYGLYREGSIFEDPDHIPDDALLKKAIAEIMKEDPDPAFLLDIHDEDVRLFQERSAYPVLVLDNRHSSRDTHAKNDKIIYYDILPDPATSLDEVMQNILLDTNRMNEIRTAYQSVRNKENRIFVYAGSLKETRNLDLFLTGISRKYGYTIFRCGGEPPLPGIEMEHADRLPSDEYLERICKSRYTLSYFGMTAMEAWYLGSIPVLFLFSSPIHNKLALDMHRRASIPLLNLGRNAIERDGSEDGIGTSGSVHETGISVSPTGLFSPEYTLQSPYGVGGEGLSRLVELVERLYI